MGIVFSQQSLGKASTGVSTKETISRTRNLLTGRYFRMSRAGCKMIRLNEGGDVTGVALQPGAQAGVVMKASTGGCI